MAGTSSQGNAHDITKQGRLVWQKNLHVKLLRYDYEECDGPSAQKMMDHLQKLVDSKELVGKKFKGEGKEFIVSKADNFEYTDPIDKSVTKKQGIRILFEDGSRVMVALSHAVDIYGVLSHCLDVVHMSLPFKLGPQGQGM